MELNKEEQTKIKEFIKDYKSIESNINLIIGEIKSLDKQKDILLTSLIETRQSENKFSAILIEKYGNIELNTETMEFEIK